MNEKAPAYVVRTIIMEIMGWSWREYRETPVWVVNDVLRTLSARALARKHGGTS